MHLNIVKTKLLPVLIIGLIAAGNSYAQSQDSSREELSTRRGRVKAQQSEVYHESALRRFEIVTLVSLPFTAIHSFLAVRGVEMIRQNRVAPSLTAPIIRLWVRQPRHLPSSSDFGIGCIHAIKTCRNSLFQRHHRPHRRGIMPAPTNGN